MEKEQYEKNKLSNKDIKREKIEELFSFFKENKMNPDDEQMVKKVENTIAQLLKLEIDELDIGLRFNPENFTDEKENSVTLNFKKEEEYGYAGSYTINPDKAPNININSFYYNKFLSSDDENERLVYCKRMLHTLYHELEHYKQHLMTKQCVSNKQTLTFARDFNLLSFRKNLYDENYYSFAIEDDANAFADKNYQEIMGEEKDLRRSQILYEGELSTGRYEYKISDEYGIHRRKGFRDDVSEKIMDAIMESVKEETREYVLKKTPILLKIYNEDGSRKSVARLIYEMKKEQNFLSRIDFLNEDEKNKLITDSKEMYYEVLHRSFKLAKEKDYEEILDVAGIEEMKELLENMREYYHKEMEEKLRQSERMQIVQSKKDDSFPTLYFRHKKPMKKMLKKNKKINKKYYKKIEHTKKVEEYLMLLQKKKEKEKSNLHAALQFKKQETVNKEELSKAANKIDYDEGR